MESVELPKAKGLKDEAFGALQFFMPGDFVKIGKELYAFARAMDDIADEMSLDQSERHRRLDVAEAVLLGIAEDVLAPTVARLRASFEAKGLSLSGSRELLTAFHRDVDHAGYAALPDVLEHARQSSMAFSLYLMEFHKEDSSLWDAAIAQGTALQMMKLVKDVHKDWSRYQRNFVPGLVADPASQPGLIKTGHQDMLQAALSALDEAADLADKVEYWRLSVMVEVLQAAARRWNDDLRQGDPLQQEIDLNWSVIMASGMKAVTSRMLFS